MAAKIPIPEEERWQLSARIAAILPVLYRAAFVDIIGDEYDRIEQQVWVVLAQEAKTVAKTYGLPVGTAKDLASTLNIITTVFFGPEIKSEQVAFDDDRAVFLVKRCPLMLREEAVYGELGAAFNRCLAFSIAAVEALNPVYTLRFVRSACQGDRNCEMKIARKEMVEKEEQGKRKKGKSTDPTGMNTPIKRNHYTSE
jgi:hypothetical protein